LPVQRDEHITCGNIECDLDESTKLMKSLGIDSAKVLACVDSQGDSLIEADFENAKSVGVEGSPSLLVNGVKVSSARTADAYKTAICSGFTDVPEECSETLDSTGSTASGSC